MRNKEVIDLIHKDLDGVNPRDDSARLKRHLAENPQAHQLYNELEELSRTLAVVEEVDPPPTLKPAVFRALHQSAQPPAQRGGVVEALRTLLQPRGALRYAYAFSFGLLVGLLIHVLYSSDYSLDSFDTSKVSGTLILSEPAGSFENGEPIHQNLGHAQVEITPKWSPSVQAIDLHLTSEEPVTAVIEVDPNNTDVRAVRQFAGPTDRLVIRDAAIEVHSAGNTLYTFFMTPKASEITPVQVRILDAGTLLYETSVSLGRTKKKP